jgi:hypothetical protein
MFLFISPAFTVAFHLQVGHLTGIHSRSSRINEQLRPDDAPKKKPAPKAGFENEGIRALDRPGRSAGLAGEGR